MLDYSRNGVTVSAMLDSRRIHKDNKYPIKIRVTFKRERKYYPTGKSLSMDEWSILSTSKKAIMLEIRAAVENTYNIIRGTVDKLINDDDFTFQALNNRLGYGLYESIEPAFHKKIEMLQHTEKYGNAQIYKNALSSLLEFAGKDIKFKDITPEWLSQYEAHCLKVKNYSISTVNFYLGRLKTIMNIARKNGVIRNKEYPFHNNEDFDSSKFSVKKARGRALALRMDELQRIYKFKPPTKRYEMFKDFWIFMYLCNGMNLADFVRLKYKDIIRDEIWFKRKKTFDSEKEIIDIKVPLSEITREIIKKWGNPVDPNNYIFPILEKKDTEYEIHKKKNIFNAIMNRYTHRIQKQLDITIPLTTYTARHTHANTLRKFNVPVAIISENLGHADERTTRAYLSSFDDEARKKTSNIIHNAIIGDSE